VKRHPEFAVDDAIEPERYEFFEAPRYEFAFERRDFLKVMGGGIAVFLLIGDVLAQEEPEEGRFRRGGGTPQGLGGWLHIGDDGRVAVYSGKVEVGQNVRTMLTQVVADELRAPVESISLVLADTGLCPFDAGTFGSRSTPAMAPQLRRVGATARELLVDLAAEELKVDRGSLSVAA
jgi:nicotinate dehydrogenase subunit B